MLAVFYYNFVYNEQRIIVNMFLSSLCKQKWVQQEWPLAMLQSTVIETILWTIQ